MPPDEPSPPSLSTVPLVGVAVNAALGVSGVRALDTCRMRTSGTRYFVEVHVEVDGQVTARHWTR